VSTFDDRESVCLLCCVFVFCDTTSHTPLVLLSTHQAKANQQGKTQGALKLSRKVGCKQLFGIMKSALAPYRCGSLGVCVCMWCGVVCVLAWCLAPSLCGAVRVTHWCCIAMRVSGQPNINIHSFTTPPPPTGGTRQRARINRGAAPENRERPGVSDKAARRRQRREARCAGAVHGVAGRGESCQGDARGGGDGASRPTRGCRAGGVSCGATRVVPTAGSRGAQTKDVLIHHYHHHHHHHHRPWRCGIAHIVVRVAMVPTQSMSDPASSCACPTSRFFVFLCAFFLPVMGCHTTGRVEEPNDSGARASCGAAGVVAGAGCEGTGSARSQTQAVDGQTRDSRTGTAPGRRATSLVRCSTRLAGACMLTTSLLVMARGGAELFCLVACGCVWVCCRAQNTVVPLCVKVEAATSAIQAALNGVEDDHGDSSQAGRRHSLRRLGSSTATLDIEEAKAEPHEGVRARVLLSCLHMWCVCVCVCVCVLCV